MILNQISYLDCLAFLVFLAPQLIIQVGLLTTIGWGLNALPFLLLKMPCQLVVERFFTRREQQSPFVQRASLFQDIVIRCVRYAFAYMPAYIGRVFFSKPVALPFVRFRMFRHGLRKCPIPWVEVKRPGLSGIWLAHDQTKKPDVVIYYCHGGGFSMGSCYFYIEFLVAWVTLLKNAGYENPALFALDYTLVPDACYPTQVQQAFSGYEYVLSIVGESSRICVGGDSAGGTLILSMLLYMGEHSDYKSRLPALATLISPWVTLVSPKNRNTRSDYLNSDSLELYGRQYAGTQVSISDPMVSPGNCKDLDWWMRASPKKGWYFQYGSEEVLGPELRDLITLLYNGDVELDVSEEHGHVHAWPVASLYLGETRNERLHGLQNLVGAIKRRMG
ncbi:alpha/beta-hydrolase [Pseudovirgaria hyperparasitica]|uniref:Alpha/beta-hydrolase n=1 Tax=Pseudovirgaria hyperparasitica TaxID=470096 RepID=A0A6A6WMF1_9PEZI|nr:alpha/beta-hydrolase [Pseudovirgaria hyperparasitica]KAF2763332.1 alpha/beta-hydrolase [Pseudovirgaria hyperparasitica]